MATQIIIKGRISNVRWLEAAPYCARKVRGDKGYWNYVFEVGAGPLAVHRDLLDRIDGGELGPATGCWYEAIELADDAELAAEEARIDAIEAAQPLHAAWQGIAAHLRSQGKPATNRACQEFAAVQIEKLRGRYRSGATAQRLAEIAAALILGSSQVAAETYGKNRDWLKSLVK